MFFFFFFLFYKKQKQQLHNADLDGRKGSGDVGEALLVDVERQSLDEQRRFGQRGRKRLVALAPLVRLGLEPLQIVCKQNKKQKAKEGSDNKKRKKKKKKKREKQLFRVFKTHASPFLSTSRSGARKSSMLIRN